MTHIPTRNEYKNEPINAIALCKFQMNRKNGIAYMFMGLLLQA